MTKITRHTGPLPAFAQANDTDERTIFGSETKSDVLDDNINSNFLRGWGIVGPNEFPTLQDFNAVSFTLGRVLAYLHQMGVAEWDSTQDYYASSVVVRNGEIYRSKSGTDESPNTGNDPATDTTNWRQVLTYDDPGTADDEVPTNADRDGRDNTFTGSNEFTNPLTVASPTTSTHAAQLATVESITKTITASGPAHYERSIPWKLKGNGSSTVANRYILVSPDYLAVNINRNGYVLESSVEIDLSDSSSWDDTSTTDWTAAVNREGKDFYIYVCEPNSGTVPDFILSPNSTIPDSMPSGDTPTEDNTRKIGGFHCLCADVGTNVANPADDPPLDELNRAFVSHDITGNTHWMTGFVAGDILPFSIWDLLHRPADWSPEGLFFDALSKRWLFIYLASWDGQQMVSAYGATIADGDSNPAFHWYNFDELLPGLPLQGIFSKASRGSPQAVNIDGGSDPGTTGGHSATDGNRIISLCGGEDMTGVLWQWGAEGGATNDVGSSWSAADTNGTAGTYDDDHNIDRGEHYEAPNRPRFGGSWGAGSRCGSRGSDWNGSPVHLDSASGARGVAEPKRVDR